MASLSLVKYFITVYMDSPVKYQIKYFFNQLVLSTQYLILFAKKFTYILTICSLISGITPKCTCLQVESLKVFFSLQISFCAA